MKTFNKSLLIFPVIISLFFFLAIARAAAPDGAGPWADTVVSTGQGLMKNGLAVPALRSDPTAALGVAENNTVDSNFFSLGFGGNIVLGFDNGISSGVIIVEATNPNYPGEKANIELSDNGVTWIGAGTVTQDGQVSVPEQINCAKFIRITDISDPAIMPDDIADGYDVDGVQAVGDSCTPQPSPSPSGSPSDSPSPSESPSPSSSPEENPSPTPGPSTTTTTSTTPGLPNTGSTPCTSSGVNSVPNITEARRTGPTSIFVSWGPDAGFSNFVVQYGFENGVWLFSTNVSGFSTTINDLPAGQSIWIHVAATDNCATGSFGTSVLVGGNASTNSPGFPNTGNPLVPRLPNTGIGPEDWSIQAGIDYILSILRKAFKN